MTTAKIPTIKLHMHHIGQMIPIEADVESRQVLEVGNIHLHQTTGSCRGSYPVL